VVLGDFMVDDANLLCCMRTALAETLLEEVVALFKCFFIPRGNIEELVMKAKGTGGGYVYEIKRNSTYLEGNVLPMDRVDSFNDGHGRLEIYTTTIELAVESEVFWEMNCNENALNRQK